MSSFELNEVKSIASDEGWALICYQENIGMVSFSKVIDNYPGRINIYITKRTVGTAIKHPTKGKTQLFRKHVSTNELKRIFNNPRSHTKKGYYNK